jgi:nitronate monooxygenase
METLPTEFGSDGSSKSKAWRDIWGSGQGIGAVRKVQPTADYVAQLEEEYRSAKARLCTN